MICLDHFVNGDGSSGQNDIHLLGLSLNLGWIVNSLQRLFSSIFDWLAFWWLAMC
jgi:hypothetical protein